jgi:hypothetical protein
MMNHDDLVASREYIFETNQPRSRDVVTVERVGWEAGIVIVVWRGGQHACVPIEEFLISAEPLVPYKGGSTFEFDPLLRKEVPPKARPRRRFPTNAKDLAEALGFPPW